MQRKILLKLDYESKQKICQALNKHLESLREQAEKQQPFSKAQEADQINEVLDQIKTQWAQELPSVFVPTEPGGIK